MMVRPLRATHWAPGARLCPTLVILTGTAISAQHGISGSPMNAPRLLRVGLISGCRVALAIDRVVAVAAAVIARGAADNE